MGIFELDFIKNKNVKKIVFLFFLILSQANAQWEYKVNISEKTIEAIGDLQFNTQFQDTIILNLSKSRKLLKSYAQLMKEIDLEFLRLRI